MKITRYLDCFLVIFFMHFEIAKFESLCPVPLVQVHQHSLLELGLAVVNSDGVVVAIKAVNECLYRRLIDMTDVRCRLAGLASRDDGLGVDQAESVDHDFTLHRLDGVNDDGD